MNKEKLRLICQCGTIWPVCDMPMDVFETMKKINAARCPTCDKSSKTACIYVGKKND